MGKEEKKEDWKNQLCGWGGGVLMIAVGMRVGKLIDGYCQKCVSKETDGAANGGHLYLNTLLGKEDGTKCRESIIEGKKGAWVNSYWGKRKL